MQPPPSIPDLTDLINHLAANCSSQYTHIGEALKLIVSNQNAIGHRLFAPADASAPVAEGPVVSALRIRGLAPIAGDENDVKMLKIVKKLLLSAQFDGALVQRIVGASRSFVSCPWPIEVICEGSDTAKLLADCDFKLQLATCAPSVKEAIMANATVIDSTYDWSKDAMKTKPSWAPRANIRLSVEPIKNRKRARDDANDGAASAAAAAAASATLSGLGDSPDK